MPGPGGGSRGGGFGGSGGRSGGGFGGGGFGHGGRHGGYHGRRPYYGGFYGGYRRPYYYGGGCLGGFFGLLIAPLIIFATAVMLIIYSFSSSLSVVSQGGVMEYDENVFQDYANEQYEKIFGDSNSYEDNLLIVFLTNEECDNYYCIAWVGDHIKKDINYMFGNESTDFGRAINSSVNSSSYKYSLDSNLAHAMETMTEKVSLKNSNSGSFTCNEDHTPLNSQLYNYTDLDLTTETVETALVSFTETTEIPVAIVVEDMSDVFEKKISFTDIFFLLLGIGLLILSVVLIVRSIKNQKNKSDNEAGNYSSNGKFKDSDYNYD